jgi:hypothetical protein
VIKMAARTGAGLPAARIDMVLDMDSLRQYLEDQRTFEGRQYDALHEAAVTLKRGLRLYARGQGRTQMVGADARIMIARVIRPFERAADQHMQAQTDLSMVWNNAVRLFTPDTKAKSSVHAFNPGTSR